MPKGLKRYYGQGQLHFITFSCYRRLPLLVTTRARNLFVKGTGQSSTEIRILLSREPLSGSVKLVRFDAAS